MSTGRKIVVVGGGPAGAVAALAAKQQDPAADVLLLNDEHCEPYEKPPLSKAVLTGKVTAHDVPIAGPKGVAGGGVVPGSAPVRPRSIAARANVVTDAGERIGYDALVLATGSINRVADVSGGRKGIYYLRTEAEARALKEHLHQSKSLLVIGGGLIELEVAASAAELGVKTAVIEIAPRILARVYDPETSRSSTTATAPAASISMPPPQSPRCAIAGRTARGRNQGGDTITADLIVVGIGVAPDDRLAKAAGLATQDGIIVDDQAGPPIRPSSRPATARFPGHGPTGWRTGATPRARRRCRPQCGGRRRRLCGGTAVLVEQFDLYIQGVGWQLPQPSAKVRRPVGAGATLVRARRRAARLRGGINAPARHRGSAAIDRAPAAVDAGELADPGKPLAAMLKAKV